MSRVGSVMQRDGARSPQQLKRLVPLHAGVAEFGVDSRRYVANGAVRSYGVAIVSPDCESFAGLIERGEHVSFRSSSHSRIEVLDEGVLRPFPAQCCASRSASPATILGFPLIERCRADTVFAASSPLPARAGSR